MAPHISNELQELIVYWRFTLDMKVSDITTLSRKSERQVYDVLYHFQEYGTLRNPLTLSHEGAKPILDKGDLDYIISILEANPVLHADEIQEKLFDYRHVDVSLPTISRALRNLSLTHKKVSHEALQRNELLRDTWIGKYGNIPKEYIIWMDESGFDGRDHQ